ncbi:unnamed protein product [Lathyrus sativus]|nr:unnamed protein product [Lathyrus sativus]
MPTPGLNIQSMDGPLDHASREIPMDENEEESEDEDEDEVVMGEGNVPSHLTIRDDNGKVILQLCGSGLVPAKEAANAINYAIHKQFYKGFYNWIFQMYFLTLFSHLECCTCLTLLLICS